MPIGSFSGIYIIFIDDEYYIGSSKNINKRITEHKRLLKQNKHYNKLLQNKYNLIKCLTSYCIERVNIDNLFNKEQEYLDKYSPKLNLSISAYIPRMSKEAIHEKQGGERNHRASILLEDAINIVRLRNNGNTIQNISNITGINLGVCTSICSGINWKEELLINYPEELNLMLRNKTELGKINKGKNTVNKLFDDTKLLDILTMLISRKYTLQEIANKYNTSKTVISGIKNLNTYSKDIYRLLSSEDLEKLKAIPKGSLKQ